MEYFKILGMNREPFSSSPDPEFFYNSHQYLSCLQQLELAIRLRRGLNVVMGNVGTGKTTLCRELILRLNQTEEDRREMETYLILDPSFSSPREFLATVARTLGVESAGTESEWQLKEDIKNHLLHKGLEEKKIIVLIIDEGQKLPDFGIEILREFLNFETNETKLLQIVIFAQREFENILRDHENFADRVNYCHILKPLGFQETMKMVSFRLARAGRA
ncbi:MAG: ATP-binding protein, partial [Syntrophales bacterium]|nr:ATP-binding protein [Syntrophales bacterium]